MCVLRIFQMPASLMGLYSRSTLFYVGGVFVSGLLVPADDPNLSLDDGTGNSSPFVIAFKRAGWAVVRDSLCSVRAGMSLC